MLPLIAAYLRDPDTTDADEREGQEVKKRKEKKRVHSWKDRQGALVDRKQLPHLDVLDAEVLEDDVEEGRVSSTSVRKEVVSPIPRNLAFGW